MTTPERLKRRQQLLGALILVMGLALIGQAAYFGNEDRNQRQCLSKTMADLTDSLDSRAAQQTRETALTSRIWAVYAEAAGVVKDPEHPHLDPEDRARINKELIASLLAYRDGIKEIQRDRKENPIPPYPEGTC